MKTPFASLPGIAYFKRSPKSLALAFACFALLGFFLLFDWDWVRPALEKYLSDHSHRYVHAEKLDVDFSLSLQPTIRLSHVYIQNAAWSSERPLLAVKEIAFSFATLSMLFADKPHISLIRIQGGEVNLERLENGLRNWRLQYPNDTSAGAYIVMAIDVQDTRLHYMDRANAVEAHANVMPGKRAASADSASAHSNRIEFSGSYRSSPFKGTALTGTAISLQKTGQMHPVQLQIYSDKTRLQASGNLGDVLLDQLIDADLTISSPSISALNPLFNSSLKAGPALELKMHLNKQPKQYHASQIQAKLGKTAFNGDIKYHSQGEHENEKIMLSADLFSDALHITDIAGLNNISGENIPGQNIAGPENSVTSETITTSTQAKPAHQKSAQPKQTGSKQGQSKQTKSKQTKSKQTTPSAAASKSGSESVRVSNADYPLPLSWLHKGDMQVTLSAAKLIDKTEQPILENIKLTAALHQGKLQITPLRAQLAGGNMDAELTLNAQTSPVTARATLNMSNIPMAELLQMSAKPALLSAPLSGHAQLQSQGDTMTSLLASASGNLQASLGQGRISNKLDAKLGLDGGKLLWLAMRGDQGIRLNCAQLQLAFSHGIGTTEKMWLATAQNSVQGHGTINLAEQTIHMLLTPHPKDPSLFSLKSNILVEGIITEPTYTLKKKDDSATSQENSKPEKALEESGC